MSFPPHLKYTIFSFLLSSLFSAQECEAAEIAATGTDEISWDKIVSIEPLGPMQVYDIEVEATHNFIAQGIVAHNTYTQGIEETASSAVEETKGGIDLNPANLNIEVIGESKGAHPQSFNPIPFDLQTFQGFSFQIISIRSTDSWETIFGLPSPETEALVS